MNTLVSLHYDASTLLPSLPIEGGLHSLDWTTGLEYWIGLVRTTYILDQIFSVLLDGNYLVDAGHNIMLLLSVLLIDCTLYLHM